MVSVSNLVKEIWDIAEFFQILSVLANSFECLDLCLKNV